MSTIRVAKNRNYSVINNTVLQDKRLSWKAKGLAAFLLSKPDDWLIIREVLKEESSDGETAVRTGLEELKRFGYLVRTRMQNERGVFVWENVLYETPRDPVYPLVDNPPMDNPLVDFPPVDFPPVDNHVLLSTDNQVLSTKDSNRARGQGGRGKFQKFDQPETPEETAILDAFIAAKKKAEPRAIVNRGRHRQAAADLAAAGWLPDQVAEVFAQLKREPFWFEKVLSLKTLSEQIGEKYGRAGRNDGADTGKRQSADLQHSAREIAIRNITAALINGEIDDAEHDRQIAALDLAGDLSGLQGP